jgi:hypothetical protein
MDREKRSDEDLPLGLIASLIPWRLGYFFYLLSMAITRSQLRFHYHGGENEEEEDKSLLGGCRHGDDDDDDDGRRRGAAIYST